MSNICPYCEFVSTPLTQNSTCFDAPSVESLQALAGKRLRGFSFHHTLCVLTSTAAEQKN